VLAAVADDPKLKVFISGGQVAMPAKHARRRLLLDVIAPRNRLTRRSS